MGTTEPSGTESQIPSPDTDATESTFPSPGTQVPGHFNNYKVKAMLFNVVQKLLPTE